MNKAILISLAAVVVTIVIIAWAALRFLRADDADPFDEIPDEPRRPSRVPEDTRIRDAAPATASTRRSQGRPTPAEEPAYAGRSNGSRGPDRERPEPRAERPRADRDWADRGRPDRSTQERSAANDRRPGQGASPSRPVPVAARAGKPDKKSADGPDWDTMSDVDYWAELAADKPFSSTSDTVVTPVSAASSRRGADTANGTTSPGRRAADPATSSTNPGRRAAEATSTTSPGRRTADPATSSTNPGRRAAEAPGPRPVDRADQGPLPTRQRPARPAAAAAGRGADFGQFPADSRPAHAPGRYANGSSEPATQSIAALARLANQAPDPAAGGPPRISQPHAVPPRGLPPRDVLARGPQLPPRDLPRDAQSRPQRPVPAPLDDDPLTSPSFPAINASDSRSYRTGRSDTQPGGRSSAASYNDPTQQFSYPDAQRPSSAPTGYPAPSAAPAGNPYGSFVSQPAASYQPAPTPQDAAYGGGAYTSQQIPGGEGWYPPPVNGNGHAGQGQAMPSSGGYLPGSTDGYDLSAYGPSQPEPVPYHQPAYPGPQYDQGGYAAQDALYGREAYQGYPGYGTGA